MLISSTLKSCHLRHGQNLRALCSAKYAKDTHKLINTENRRAAAKGGGWEVERAKTRKRHKLLVKK